MESIFSIEDRHASGLMNKRPVALVRGEGARVWDSEGKEYIDCMAGHGVANVGHAHPKVTAAIAEQAATLVTCSEAVYNDQRAAFLAALAAHMPGDLNRFYLCNSGAEAIEAAIKFARVFTGKTGIIATNRGFHGRTMGALSATWNPKYRDPFKPLAPGFKHVAYDDLGAAAAAVDEETAAVLVEPIQGEGGVHVPSEGYLVELQALCQARGVLLIIDEIQTGLGRTGAWFASDHVGLAPDIMCMGKALGGGVPMGAVAWRESLGTLPSGVHGSTFGGNPLACAAGRAVLDVLAEEGLPERAAVLGAALREGLEMLDLPVVRSVRGKGLMIGLDLRQRVMPYLKGLLDAGVLALPAGPTVLRLLPPLVISDEDVDAVVEAVATVLSANSKERA
jgi:LysW-gamma-L-lysine/LysW-L-ornithine aminotransferase